MSSFNTSLFTLANPGATVPIYQNKQTISGLTGQWDVSGVEMDMVNPALSQGVTFDNNNMIINGDSAGSFMFQGTHNTLNLSGLNQFQEHGSSNTVNLHLTTANSDAVFDGNNSGDTIDVQAKDTQTTVEHDNNTVNYTNTGYDHSNLVVDGSNNTVVARATSGEIIFGRGSNNTASVDLGSDAGGQQLDVGGIGNSGKNNTFTINGANKDDKLVFQDPANKPVASIDAASGDLVLTDKDDNKVIIKSSISDLTVLFGNSIGGANTTETVSQLRAEATAASSSGSTSSSSSSTDSKSSSGSDSLLTTLLPILMMFSASNGQQSPPAGGMGGGGAQGFMPILALILGMKK